jgi:CheY-like chemotaxis protein
MNILLVDDDLVDVMNVRRAFERGHITDPIWVASDGIEALELLRGTTLPADHRLVLLDINMPRMNGLELLRELRADPALHATPVVVLTTSNDDRDRTEAYAHNVAGYLLKPVTFADFVDMISALHHYWARVQLP